MRRAPYIKLYPAVLLLAVLAAAIPPLFLHLGSLPLQLFDEARIAVSAQEMMRNHNLLVVHYGGAPDMWSVKPPLMVWLQALSMHLWGMHEWATRLPGAIASTCTCIIVYLFLVWKKAPLAGFIAVLVLITSQGFVTLHCSRTGDYDALLTFFTTAYCFSYFAYLQEGKPKFLYLTFIFLTLAVLTKGVAALLFLPALLLFTLYKKSLLRLLKEKHLYLSLVTFLLFVLGYYLLRKHYNPGYIQAVQQNELGGRYSQALEGNKGTFLYYFHNMALYQFKPWYWLIVPGVLAGLFMDNKKYRDLTVYLILLNALFFLVISSAQTKLYWYAMPMYPFLSAIVGLFIYCVFSMLQKRGRWTAVLSYLLLPVVFLLPYKEAIALNTALPNIGSQRMGNEHMAEYLHNALEGKQSITGRVVIYTGYQANINWYLEALGHRNDIQNNLEKADSVENIIVFQDSVKKYMETHYQTTILQAYYNVTVYRLNGKRQ
ncbi:MAG: glycosyltransferase family 39 protein [Flavipsychrobacter sp.]|nr:glycosyltransferase family 39 protein [Flavipsychrobacter sp.]